MTQLSVNMNVAALLRNRREHPWPNVIDLARIALQAGAAGITVHPRPDERHTRPSDVRALRTLLDAEFPDRELNVEGFPERRFTDLVHEVRADQVTLVPDSPDQATSDHGWDFASDGQRLSEHVNALKAPGRRISLFADPDAHHMEAAARTGADRVELYTGPYGGTYGSPSDQKFELGRLLEAAKAARKNGLGVNAGHDLTVPGTTTLVHHVPDIDEVSIGHALFCDALTHGMRETVRRYVDACRQPAPRRARDATAAAL